MELYNVAIIYIILFLIIVPVLAIMKDKYKKEGMASPPGWRGAYSLGAYDPSLYASDITRYV